MSVPVPQQMDASGNYMGARLPPSCLMLLCNPSCAISAYETGDPTDGSLSGAALIACLLNWLCWPFGSLYAMMCWKPDPKNIRGDGTMRTINNRCFAVWCINGTYNDAGCCVIAHWQSGDGCTDCCEGDAGMACMINVVGYFIGGLPLGDWWACCCWNPNPSAFKRTAAMHGGKPGNPGMAVAQPMMVQQPVMMVQQPVAMVQQPMMVQQPVMMQAR